LFLAVLLIVSAVVLPGCQSESGSPAPGSSNEANASTAAKSQAARSAPKEVPADAYENTAAAIEALLQAAQKSDTDDFNRAETWLVTRADSAVAPLGKILNDEQGDLLQRIAVCRPLRKMGPPAKPVFQAALESSSQQIQLNAIKGLGLIRPTDAQIIEILNGYLDAEDERVRREAILGLENIGPPAEQASTAKLIAILNDTEENETLRDAARRALDEVNPRHTFAD
jgi:HEAT repeat protein